MNCLSSSLDDGRVARRLTRRLYRVFHPSVVSDDMVSLVGNQHHLARNDGCAYLVTTSYLLESGYLTCCLINPHFDNYPVGLVMRNLTRQAMRFFFFFGRRSFVLCGQFCCRPRWTSECSAPHHIHSTLMSGGLITPSWSMQWKIQIVTEL